MKLFLTVVLASVLMMKTAEGAAKDLGVACTSGTDTCPTNAECVDDGGTDKCSCMATYTEPTSAAGTCKKISGQECADDGDCAIGACTNEKCGKKNGDGCTINTDCVTFNCKYVDASSQKCADAGAAGVVASVLLMVATLMTSRIL